MKIISEANQSVLTMLTRFLKNDKCVRWSHFCVHTPVEGGVLVLNMLTRELVLLTMKEYNNPYLLDYLKKHWFVVPDDMNEKEVADFIKCILHSRCIQPKEITDYTIFTTTDCNARCFYCFELGRSRIPMGRETAEKVVQFIKAHCGGKRVSIRWFGGEPLYNADVINIISSGLRNEGIEFESKMVSNGYLFDDNLVHMAVNNWNLKKVQITLDGTAPIYNKIKSYIYRDTNAFEIVMDNILLLLHNGIFVSIRLNMDMYNAEDLLLLADELAVRFAGMNGISVYAHHLFINDTPDAELHSEDEWKIREKAMDRIYERLEANGLLHKRSVSKNIKLHHCMADSGKSVTILPDGHLGLCEHYTESEFIGHLDSKEYDLKVAQKWKERVPEIPECAECFYYLDCIMLKMCSNDRVCYEQSRRQKYKSIQRAMIFDYGRWRKKNTENELTESVTVT